MLRRSGFFVVGYALACAPLALAGVPPLWMPALASIGGAAAVSYAQKRGWVEPPDRLNRPITIFGDRRDTN